MSFGIGVPTFAAESGSGIVSSMQVDITRIGLAHYADRTCITQRPEHQVSPPSIARRLVGACYQLDLWHVQAGPFSDNGQHQEDPIVRWPGKSAYTDAIYRNVITPLASRFQAHGIR